MKGGGEKKKKKASPCSLFSPPRHVHILFERPLPLFVSSKALLLLVERPRWRERKRQRAGCSFVKKKNKIFFPSLPKGGLVATLFFFPKELRRRFFFLSDDDDAQRRQSTCDPFFLTGPIRSRPCMGGAAHSPNQHARS